MEEKSQAAFRQIRDAIGAAPPSAKTAGLLAITILSLTGSCLMFQKRPWYTPVQRTDFMLKMTADLVDDVPDHCIEEIQRRLHDDTPKRVSVRLSAHVLGQDSMEVEVAPRACEDALRGCGNCHLPRTDNNCNYEIHFGPEDGPVRRERGQVTKITPFSLEIESKGSESLDKHVKIPRRQIRKSVWLDGADPIETWWDFQSVNARGKTARRMLDLAATHGVACVNCHVRHGDFGLTKEGKHFQKTGEVIKRVPLFEMR